MLPKYTLVCILVLVHLINFNSRKLTLFICRKINFYQLVYLYNIIFPKIPRLENSFFSLIFEATVIFSHRFLRSSYSFHSFFTYRFFKIIILNVISYIYTLILSNYNYTSVSMSRLRMILFYLTLEVRKRQCSKFFEFP